MPRGRVRTTVPWLPLVVGALLLTACGDGDNSDAGAPEPTQAPGTTLTPSAGCTGEASVPDDAASQAIDDVDGDGRGDTAYLAGPPGDLIYGIVTAAGGEATFRFESASPVERRALTVDVDERGPVEVLLSDGRSVQLLAFVDCGLLAVQGPDGEPYRFDRGFTGNGTGVGTFDATADAEAVELLTEVTCGEHTLTDGLSGRSVERSG